MASHKLLEIIGRSDIAKITNGVFVEIGSSREENVRQSSTYYFYKKCKARKIEFLSVDFAKESYLKAKKIAGTNAVHMDGKEFLINYKRFSKKPISLLYLDNFDVVYNLRHKKSLLRRVGNTYKKLGQSITNRRSAEVHYQQVRAALPHMAKSAVIIFDDTYLISNRSFWGKGSKSIPYLLKTTKFRIKGIGHEGFLMANFPLKN